MAQDDDADRARPLVPISGLQGALLLSEWTRSQQEQIRGEPLELFQDCGIRRVVSTRVPALSSHSSADAPSSRRGSLQWQGASFGAKCRLQISDVTCVCGGGLQ